MENFTCDLAFELMVLADEYLLSRLRQICECQLQTFVNSMFLYSPPFFFFFVFIYLISFYMLIYDSAENACSMLAYGHSHNANDLKQFCMNFIMKVSSRSLPSLAFLSLFLLLLFILVLLSLLVFIYYRIHFTYLRRTPNTNTLSLFLFLFLPLFLFLFLFLFFFWQHFETISPTKGYQDLKSEPDLLLEISRMLPKHLAQPINLAKKLAPKNRWSSLVFLLVPAVFVFVAGFVYMKRSRV